MNFSALPWFIRREIIDLIIESNSSYCSVSREWLIQTANRQGEIQLDGWRFKSEVRSPAYVVNFGSIRFSRILNIDWDVINRYKSLQRATFSIEPGYTKTEWIEFSNKLLQLPLLKIIHVYPRYKENNLDISQFLMNQCKVEELKTPWDNLRVCLNSNTNLYPNLSDLKINGVDSSFDMGLLINNLPKLKILEMMSNFNGNGIGFGFESFGNYFFPTIRCLSIKTFLDDKSINLDLSKWPNLTKLYVNCDIRFINLDYFQNIKYLSFSSYNEFIADVVNAKLYNLHDLSIDFKDTPSTNVILDIIKLCKSIASLNLVVNQEFEFPNDLPVASYTLTELNLAGEFHINSNLLNWLSNNFKLRRLDLYNCTLKEDTVLEVVPFDTLTSLTISSDHHGRFRKYLNRTLYPHINDIDYSRLEGSCSQYSDYYDYDLSENSSSEV